MAKCLTRTRRSGGSLVVTLTKELVKMQKIKENEFLEISVKKCRKTGFGAFKGMKPFTFQDELKAFE